MGRSLLRRASRAAALGFAALGAISSAHAQNFAEMDGWPNFGSRSSSSWDQPFDRSFSKQWEANPERGFPTISSANVGPMKAAIRRYADIVAEGGWEPLPMIELRTGVTHSAVVRLRRRLELSGDLRQSGGYPSTFDFYVEKALRRAQERHGLPPTGMLDKATVLALNVPASARLRQLRTNLVRVQSLAETASGMRKYVFVNIPAAQIEAVEGDRVVSRHSGVVGKPDRQTPILRSSISEINFNKDWIVPPTVIREDLIPKGREGLVKGQTVLQRYKVDVYRDYTAYSRGQKIDPATIDWNSSEVMSLFYAQKAGDENPLGYLKINFPNTHQTYMHDTPSQSIFSRSFRAESSGCIRVQNITQLASWLLEDNGGWSPPRVAEMKRTGERLDVQLKKQVPLYFAYVTAWATPDGAAQFRRDLYQRDGVGAVASTY